LSKSLPALEQQLSAQLAAIDQLLQPLGEGRVHVQQDQVTSHLDLSTERAVHANLSAFGGTRIVIPHRLSTVPTAGGDLDHQKCARVI